ncbi:MAG TPA: hypothetical protein VH115_04620 [Solirubrobacteraceae bacterium]|nr:hypothetical protein [Solirubrobacteraceae bacterium]
MTEAVVAAALAVAALNVPPALLGGWLWYWGEPTERGTRAFWILLRIGQGSVLMLAIAIGSLAAAGKRSSEGLFYLYALLPIAISFIAEQMRIASAQIVLDERGLENAKAVGRLDEHAQRHLVSQIVRREVAVMAISAVVVVFLALRAASTAHGF